MPPCKHAAPAYSLVTCIACHCWTVLPFHMNCLSLIACYWHIILFEHFCRRICSYIRWCWLQLHHITTCTGVNPSSTCCSGIGWGFMVRLGWDLAWGKLSEHEVDRARELREIVTSLGPAYIKLGQALSIRPDILSPAAMYEMQKLCDKVCCRCIWFRHCLFGCSVFTSAWQPATCSLPCCHLQW